MNDTLLLVFISLLVITTIITHEQSWTCPKCGVKRSRKEKFCSTQVQQEWIPLEGRALRQHKYGPPGYHETTYCKGERP